MCDTPFMIHMKRYRHRLLDLPYVKALVTGLADRPIASEIDISTLQGGDIVQLTTDVTAGYGYVHHDAVIPVPRCPHHDIAPYHIHQEVDICAKDISNYGSAKGMTSVILFIANYTVLSDVFEDLIPYVEEDWNIGKIESQIAADIMSGIITVQQARTYIDRGYHLCHAGELMIPTITPKSFTTDPKIKDRREELYRERSEILSDPDKRHAIPEILSSIEQELIAMDKSWLEGDDSQGFLNPSAKKSYGVHRKNMMLTGGAKKEFTDGAAQYTAIERPLVEGWDPKTFPTICDQARDGSYSRGKETAKGGALTKLVFRIFQDIFVVSDDCGTKRGIRNTITAANAKSYYGRTIIYRGKSVILSADTIGPFIDTVVHMRSPMYCASEAGVCFTCMGESFRVRNDVSVGVGTVAVTSKMLLSSMKKMHGSTLTMLEVNVNDHFRKPSRTIGTGVEVDHDIDDIEE